MAPNRGSARGRDKAAQRRGHHQPPQQRNVKGPACNTAPIWLQQKVLSVFVRAFPHLLTPSNVDDKLRPTLQQVKSHLYARDFDKAFGRREYLEAYAARWSASRALGYLEIFAHVFNEMPSLCDSQSDNLPEERSFGINNPLSASHHTGVIVTCLGGGAGAELCALAALPHLLTSLKDVKFNACLIDIADWSTTLEALYKSVTRAVSTSATSDSIRESDVENDHALISETQISYNFLCMDLLGTLEDNTKLLHSQAQKSDLITLMFTLNELYSTSIPKTQTLLLDLTANVRPGTLFLVVDSAGSYSSVTVNQKEKKYPMQWLLDHTLLTLAPDMLRESHSTGARKAQRALGDDTSGDEGKKASVASSEGSGPPTAVWERIQSTDSQWFRLPELQHPLELENMRYQLHLYRRV